ncbi:hypothetical protein LXL04_021089 [Taraxacum kok-saghyz]
MEITPVPTVNLFDVLSESRRILKANYTHFVALSLFFLPLAFSLVTTPALHHHHSGNFFTGDIFRKLLTNHPKVVIFHLLYILIIYLLAVCAIGTISYSTYHVFIGKPVNYFDSLKSLTFSFFPLISTAIVAQVVLFAISIVLVMFTVKIHVLAETLGFAIDYNSIYFMWFSIFVGATCIAVIIYVHMNWCLASMVVVAESISGGKALRRSWYLVKGMRSISLSLSLYFLIGNGLLALISSKTVKFRALNSDTHGVVLFTILGSFFLMMCFLASTAANTVLYMYCKAFHGELGLKIAVGFDYVNLPSDDKKVPHVDEKVSHVVTVVET